MRRLREDGVRVRTVTGYFDPLLADHARRLAEARGDAACLVVIVDTPAKPILSARARAELVSSLSMVDYVVLPEHEDAAHVLSRIGGDAVRMEAEDEQLAQNLIRHVHSRQRAS